MLTSERKMYRPLSDFFERRGCVVLREVTTLQGRVDVVALQIDWDAARQRWSSGLHKGVQAASLLRAWLAMACVPVPVSVDALSEHLRVTRATASASIRALIEHGFAARVGDGAVRRVDVPEYVREIICCEAKLTDWRRCLSQALGHRFYANRCYVALANVSPAAVDHAELGRRGVGLLWVRDGGVQEELPAIERQPTNHLTRRQIGERAWHELRGALRGQRRSLRGESRATV